MESWCFDSLEKGYVANETAPPYDSITISKNVSMGLEPKEHLSCHNDMLIPSQPSVGNPGFPEASFAADMLKTQFPHDSGRNVFSSNGSVKVILNPSIDTSNTISRVDDSTLNLSSSVVHSDFLESSLIDLKLDGYGNKPNSDSSRAAPISSSSESPRPAKRARVTNLGSQTAYCQVYKCNKDLSSAKDYYKRHRVCEAHSKTPKVLVNGIEQRFCQQCSRFHLVAEFDDGKRSCRKRLAEHNERRRKPQGSFNGSTAERSLHSHAGSEGTWFQGSTLTLTSTSTSLMCQEMNGFSTPEKHRTNVEEDGPKCVEKSETTCTNTQQQKSVLLQNPQGIVSNLFQTKPLMNEDFTLEDEDFALFDGASTVEALQGVSDSSCALSLLSSQLHQVGNHNQTRHIRHEAEGFFSGLVNSNFTNS